MISEGSIRNFENGRKLRTPGYLEKIQDALEEAGVAFLADGEQTGGGPGVRLAK